MSYFDDNDSDSLVHGAPLSVWFVSRLEMCRILTLRTSEVDIPALRKLPCGVRSQYTGGTVCQHQASEVGIPTLFSNAYWNLNA